MSGAIKDLRCPRCGSSNIRDYGKIFECIDCHLEFYKELNEDIQDEDILSIQELKSFFDSFLPSDKKNKKRRR